ncbi:MAG: hypothetical protein HFG92_18300 [Dorea sp.]|jgi:hypothetical protein|nr:hypothetical protein [Dorea sp.]
MWRLNEKNDKGQEGSGYLPDGPAPCPDGGNIDWSGIQPFHYKTSFVLLSANKVASKIPKKSSFLQISDFPYPFIIQTFL